MAQYICALKIVIVGGFEFDHLKTYVNSFCPDAEIVQNINYRMGNLYSLQCALPFIDDEFLLFNVDHVFSRKLIETVYLKSFTKNEIIIFCDHLKEIQDDQMKVRIEENKLSKIAKNLSNYHTGYIGLTYCPNNMLESYIQACSYMAKKNRESIVVESVLNHLVSQKKRIQIVDVSGFDWFEVDTPEDVKQAEHLVTAFPDIWV